MSPSRPRDENSKDRAGQSLDREALMEQIALKRKDKRFQETRRRIMEENREILDRLAKE
jgi:hypothetical protein